MYSQLVVVLTVVTYVARCGHIIFTSSISFKYVHICIFSECTVLLLCYQYISAHKVHVPYLILIPSYPLSILNDGTLSHSHSLHKIYCNLLES